MTVSHSGAQVQSSTDPGLAIQTFNLTDNDVDCGQVNLTIDHPDTIVSSADSPLEITATFTSAQSVSPTLSYTNNGSTVTYTMGLVSGTISRKNWDYSLPISGPSGQQLFEVGSASVTLTYDDLGPQIYSLDVNDNNTAVDVIFTEDLFADYIAHTATGTVVAADFSLTISSTTASLTSATPTSLSVTNTMLTDGKKYTLGFSLNGATSPGDAITVGVSTHTYDIAGNAVVALQVTDTTELFVVTTVGLTDDIPYAEITNCDDIKFQATFNQAVIAPVILQITDSSSNNLFELGMTLSQLHQTLHGKPIGQQRLPIV